MATFTSERRKITRLRRNPKTARTKPYAASTLRRFRRELNLIQAELDTLQAQGYLLTQKTETIEAAFFANEEKIKARSKASEKGWVTRRIQAEENAVATLLARLQREHKQRGKQKHVKLTGEAKPYVTRINLSKMDQEQIVALVMLLMERGVRKLRFSRFTDRNIYPGGEGEYATGWRWSGRWTDLRRKNEARIREMIGQFMTSSYIKTVDVSHNDLKKLPTTFQVPERETPEDAATQRAEIQAERKRIRKEHAKAKQRREAERRAKAIERERAAEKKIAKLFKQIDKIDFDMQLLKPREQILLEKTR